MPPALRPWSCRPAALFRRLELGSTTRRRAGAAVENACHRASSSRRIKRNDAPSLSGTTQLEETLVPWWSFFAWRHHGHEKKAPRRVLGSTEGQVLARFGRGELSALPQSRRSGGSAATFGNYSRDGAAEKAPRRRHEHGARARSGARHREDHRLD
jgi:hypothetical protein